MDFACIEIPARLVWVFLLCVGLQRGINFFSENLNLGWVRQTFSICKEKHRGFQDITGEEFGLFLDVPLFLEVITAMIILVHIIDLAHIL